MPDELDAEPARIEGVYGIRIAGGELRQLSLEVELIERRVDFVEQRLLVFALEPGNVILAGLVVGSHGDDALVALVRSVASHGFGALVVLGVDLKIEWAALSAGDRRRAGVGADQKHLAVHDPLVDRHHHVGERDACNDRHLFLFDQFLSDLVCNFRLELAITLDHLDRDPTEFAAVAIDHQHKGVVHVLAERARRPRQFSHKTDLDRLLREREGRRE